MKKNYVVAKSAAIVLLVTMITLILVSGTYSKYTTSVTSDDTAVVASWNISVNGNNITVNNPTTTFDLFSTIKDTADGNNEADVLNSASQNLIAPGTQGSFDLVVKNDSQVTAEYKISFVETKSSASLPIEYSLNGTSGWKSNLNELDISTTPKRVAMNGTSQTTTIYWRWAFTGGESSNYTTTQTDTTDTKLGTDAVTSAATVMIQATLTASQVN